CLGTIRVGQWRQPFGMDGLTSVKEMTFLERGLPFAFLPFRQIGIGFFNHNADETVTWALSGFRFPTDPFGGNVGDSGGYGLASRITTILWHNLEETRLLHMGAGYTMGNPANNLVRYRNQPEFFISETGGSDIAPAGVPANVPVFVDTGAIDTDTFQQASLELAALVGSLHLQSEAIVAAVKQTNGDTATFSGAYAQAGYVLTGEVRPYVRNNGVFGRIKPKCSFGTQGMGAWEIACRWSYLDLNDSNIAGGYLHNATVGLNWYLNPNTKVQFNYIHSFLDDPLLDKSEADIFAFRGQIDF
ncbi:MAG: porin, partial [Planctomycetales bacterium]|nr:porin [Planctomycetales bacterium]